MGHHLNHIVNHIIPSVPTQPWSPRLQTWTPLPPPGPPPRRLHHLWFLTPRLRRSNQLPCGEALYHLPREVPWPELSGPTWNSKENQFRTNLEENYDINHEVVPPSFICRDSCLTNTFSVDVKRLHSPTKIADLAGNTKYKILLIVSKQEMFSFLSPPCHCRSCWHLVMQACPNTSSC